jgi:hypothetical protein
VQAGSDGGFEAAAAGMVEAVDPSGRKRPSISFPIVKLNMGAGVEETLAFCASIRRWSTGLITEFRASKSLW